MTTRKNKSKKVFISKVKKKSSTAWPVHNQDQPTWQHQTCIGGAHSYRDPPPGGLSVQSLTDQHIQWHRELNSVTTEEERPNTDILCVVQSDKDNGKTSVWCSLVLNEL